MKRVTDYFSATVPAAKKAATAAAPINTATTAQRTEQHSKEHPWSKDDWVTQLPSDTRELLELEIKTLDASWLEVLHTELTKPYFLKLKRYIKAQKDAKVAVFPPEQDIYSWSRLTPLCNVKVLILGQDPYHNIGQAHGLAFSVRPPTRAPPSLLNIYKELQACYPDTFDIPRHGSLIKWAKQGVLMLNACLTVEAHKANSHANHGWEQFTEEVIKAALKYNPHVVIMAWGSPAAKRVERANPAKHHLILKSVHPSPLSASRGWFGTKHFVKANAWLEGEGLEAIDWHLLPKHVPQDQKLEMPRLSDSTIQQPSEPAVRDSENRSIKT